MSQPYLQYPAVFTDDHAFYICRCGATVMLSIHGTDARPCASCGRRHTWDGDTIRIIRPAGERER